METVPASESSSGIISTLANNNSNKIMNTNVISFFKTGGLSPTIEGKTRPGETKCLEPGCDFRCQRLPQLRAHLSKEHKQRHDATKLNFNSKSDFEEWLNKIQKDKKCTYMRRRGWQVNKNGSKTACFYCHRGGSYTSKAKLKKTKKQGSCKTGIECTSSMKVVFWYFNKPPQTANVDDEDHLISNVTVEAFLQHYGHNIDLEHVRISKTEKEIIVNRLNSGLSRNKVLDEIRETLDNSDEPSRLHLISMQDIYNIQKNCCLTAFQNTIPDDVSDDNTTVQAWVQSLQFKEDYPVLLIKYQQEESTTECSCLKDEDFMLILQTPLQSKLLFKHGQNSVVCIDVTQGTIDATVPNEGFFLATIAVVVSSPIDLTQRVHPVAWFVCNRIDKDVITVFLTQVRERLFRTMNELNETCVFKPQQLVVPSPGLTEDVDWYSEIWNEVFEKCNSKILAPWHLLNDWKLQIEKIPKIQSNLAECTRLVNNFQTVINEQNEEQFKNFQEQFHKDLNADSSTQPLADYYNKSFAGDPFIWAKCYRTARVEQVMQLLDEYHTKLIRVYYNEGFKRKQLDILIKTLLKYSRDKTLRRLKKTYRANNEIIKVQTEQKHSNYFQDKSNYKVSCLELGKKWAVDSVVDCVSEKDSTVKRLKLTNIVEFVSQKNHDCLARINCLHTCTKCGVCVHQLKCDCEFYQKYKILCEHCHSVPYFEWENNRDFPPSEELTEHEPPVAKGLAQIFLKRNVVVQDLNRSRNMFSVIHNQQTNEGTQPSTTEICHMKSPVSNSPPKKTNFKLPAKDSKEKVIVYVDYDKNNDSS